MTTSQQQARASAATASPPYTIFLERTLFSVQNTLSSNSAWLKILRPGEVWILTITQLLEIFTITRNILSMHFVS